jgi:hypothetical protein
MKNKSVTYLLGAVVLLIWGLVFYRFFSAANEDDLPIPVSAYSTSKVNKSNTEADSFELISDYRDPFLGQWTGGINADINNAPKVRKKVAKVVAPIVVAPPIDWSFVTYLGTIHGKQSKKKLAILKLNDREMMVGDNDKVGELTVLKIGKDSVLVSFQGVSKVLR